MTREPLFTVWLDYLLNLQNKCSTLLSILFYYLWQALGRLGHYLIKSTNQNRELEPPPFYLFPFQCKWNIEEHPTVHPTDWQISANLGCNSPKGTLTNSLQRQGKEPTDIARSTRAASATSIISYKVVWMLFLLHTSLSDWSCHTKLIQVKKH